MESVIESIIDNILSGKWKGLEVEECIEKNISTYPYIVPNLLYVILTNMGFMGSSQREEWHKYKKVYDHIKAKFNYDDSQRDINGYPIFVKIDTSTTTRKQKTPPEQNQTVVTRTDFSHMESFTPTIPFNMSALYSFLIKEEVIKHIDEPLFSDCISHAHINELWEYAKPTRKRNLMQALFKTLSEYYETDWINSCANHLHVDKKKITNPTDSKTVSEFKTKLGKVLNFRQSFE